MRRIVGEVAVYLALEGLQGVCGESEHEDRGALVFGAEGVEGGTYFFRGLAGMMSEKVTG